MTPLNWTRIENMAVLVGAAARDWGRPLGASGQIFDL